MGLRCILFLISFDLISLIFDTPIESLSKWWSCVVVAVNIVTLAILLIVCKSGGITYKQLIGYEKGKTSFNQIILMIFVIFVVGMGGMFLAGFLCYQKFPYMAVMMIEPIPIGLAVFNCFLLPITTTLAEDGLYLGAGVNQIKNKWLAIIVPSFFYAFQHSFIPVIFEWRYIAYRLLSFLPLAVLMCVIYYKKRNPLPLMIGHFVINLATVAQILITSISPELYQSFLGL